MSLLDELKKARLRAGLSQSELARRIGLSPSQVSLIEAGRRSTRVHVIDAWAEACDHEIVMVGPDDVLLESDDIELLSADQQRQLLRMVSTIVKKL